MNATEEQLQRRMSERLKARGEVEDLAQPALRDVLRRLRKALSEARSALDLLGEEKEAVPIGSITQSLPTWRSLDELLAAR